MVNFKSFLSAIITAHQGFIAREALSGIAQTMLKNISLFGKTE